MSLRVSYTAADAAFAADEESPSTTEQECRITSCGGDFKESATEIYRNFGCKGGNAG